MNRDNSVDQCNEYKKQEIQREGVEERIEIQSACNKKTHRDEQSDGQDRGSQRPLAEAETGLSNSRRTQFKLPLLKRQ